MYNLQYKVNGEFTGSSSYSWAGNSGYGGLIEVDDCILFRYVLSRGVRMTVAVSG